MNLKRSFDIRNLCILILVSILLCCNAITHASKQEWIDKVYDFSMPNKIGVSLNCPASVNEISELEVKDIFAQKMREISAKLQRTGRDLYGWSDVIAEMERNNIDLKEISRKDPVKANEMIRDYI
ncbi:MAG: hypothetical protein LUF25_03705 [Phascolarctobacterium sp.]|nr:hypothetical protein [Phascolarctobacterium sp.]